MKNKNNSISRETEEYIETMANYLGQAVVMISKGQSWIEVGKKGVRLTGVTEEDSKQAGIIQLMFNEAVEKKKLDIDKVQNALNYFGWDIKLERNEDGVSFNGKDRFLIVQIAHYMGGVDNKTYAGQLREAIKSGERIYF